MTGNRYQRLAEQAASYAATAETEAPDQPLTTELDQALRLIEIHDSCTIEAMTALEQALDALRSQPSAIAIRVVTSLHRDGQLEVLRIDRNLRPTTFWVVNHVAHDQAPDQTRFLVLSEHESPGEAEDAMAFRVTTELPPDFLLDPEPEPDLVKCVVCREQEARYTWSPLAPEEGQEPAKLPICNLCAALIREGQMVSFQAGDITYSVVGSAVFGAKRVTG